MIYTPKSRTAAFALVTAILFLLSTESPAAYFARKGHSSEMHAKCVEMRSPGDKNLNNFTELRNLTRLNHITDNEAKHGKINSSERALILGAVAVVSFLIGLASLGIPADGSAVYLVLLSYAFFSFLAAPGLGIAAIITGIKGLISKKHASKAIVGLILGSLALVAAILTALVL